MTHSSDPARFHTSLDPSDPLATALADARRDVPDSEQIAALAARFGLDGSGTGVARVGSARRGLFPGRGGRLALVALAASVAAGAAVIGFSRNVERPSPSSSLGPTTHPATTPAAVPAVPETPAPTAAPAMDTVVTPSASPRRTPAPAEPTPRPELPSAVEFPTVGSEAAVAPRETETALLGRAQRALASDPALALSLCQKHATEYPQSGLSQEREVIAIGALVSLGRRSEALSRAAAFRAKYPGSAHLRRLERLGVVPTSAGGATPATEP
jgi:hypothetical protein